MIWTLSTASQFYRIVGRKFTEKFYCRTYGWINHRFNLPLEYHPSHHYDRGRGISVSCIHCNQDENSLVTTILQNLNPEEQKSLKVLKLWYHWKRIDKPDLPDSLTDLEWLHLLTSPQKKRIKILEDMCSGEKNTCQESEKTEDVDGVAKRVENVQGFLYLTLRDHSVLMYKLNQILLAKLYGQTIVFDFEMAYTDITDAGLNLKCMRRILEYYSKISQYTPIHIVLCNLNKNVLLYRLLERKIHLPLIEEKLTLTSQSYLDLYSKENLVYLIVTASPKVYAPAIVTYNSRQVFVVSATYSGRNIVCNIRDKAVKEGITVAKLPYHLHDSGGGKINTGKLNAQNCVEILTVLHNTRSWKDAINTIKIDETGNNEGGVQANSKKCEMKKYKKPLK